MGEAYTPSPAENVVCLAMLSRWATVEFFRQLQRRCDDDLQDEVHQGGEAYGKYEGDAQRSEGTAASSQWQVASKQSQVWVWVRMVVSTRAAHGRPLCAKSVTQSRSRRFDAFTVTLPTTFVLLSASHVPLGSPNTLRCLSDASI